MIRIIIYSLLALVVIGVVALMWYTRPPDESDIKSNLPARLDSLASLPSDPKAASRELKNVKKALDKIRPSTAYVVIDTHASKIFLRTRDSILVKSDCSTGTGGELIDSVTHRKWIFDTPRGVFKVNSKIKQPWWRKPDWAFIEDGEKIPKDEKERLDPAMMGDYAIGFGNGYFIHGTIYERLLGVNVTHGCVRVGADGLEKIFNKVQMGTPIYIF
jgi:lipoprotein-anchoring transpeptidase ErfK/SrfK